jgi:methyl-accepting chemotaxis protein
VKKISISRKFSIAISIGLLLFTLATIALIFTIINHSTGKSVSRFAVQISENIASHMNLEDYETFLEDRTQSDLYWQLRNELNDFREKIGALYVYTVELNEEGDIVLMIDGQPEGSDVASEIGEIMESVDISPILKGESVSTGIVDDPEYSRYVSAYAPLKNKEGEILGAIGVDLAVEQVDGITKEVIFDVLPIVVAGSIVIFFLFNSAVLIYVRRTIRPLTYLEKAAKQLEEGNIIEAEQTLQTDIKSWDEIGSLYRTFKQMIVMIKQIIRDISLNAEQLSSSSEQLSGSTDESVRASEEVANAIETVAVSASNEIASMEAAADKLNEISGHTYQIVSIAEETKKVTDETYRDIIDGGKIVNNTVEQINLIKNSVAQSNLSLQVLHNKAKKIGDIVSVIRTITEQTNLLALNASIEAARAGEYGKGFAVVAEEVRKLAEESEKSAKQIEQLIYQTQKESEETVSSMEKVNENVERGISITKATEKKFNLINEKIEVIVSKIEQISYEAAKVLKKLQAVSESAKVLTKTANENANASNVVSTSTEEQLAIIEEISAASSSLAEMSESLLKIVQKFRI